jgi:hypothetical protein
MGIEHGKDYTVTQNDGEHRITRNDRVVGTWKNFGFKVTIPGVATMKTATELRAHAFAEVALKVPPSERQWVMTAYEYDQDEAQLADDKKKLLEAYPLTNDLETSVSRWRSSTDTDLLKEDVRLQLLNVVSGAVVPHLKRPDKFPEPVKQHRIDEAH